MHILIDHKAFDGAWYVRSHSTRLGQQAARRYPKKVARHQAKRLIRTLSSV
jgi:RNase P protein component